MKNLQAELSDLQRLRAKVAADDTSIKLAQIDAQIAEVQRQMEAEREAERLAALAVAVDAQTEAERVAFQATAALLSALDKLQSTRERVASYGGNPCGYNRQFHAQIATLVQKQQAAIAGHAEPQTLAPATSVWGKVVEGMQAMSPMGTIRR